MYKIVSIQELAPIIKATLQAGNMAEIVVTGESMLPLLISRKSKVRLKPPTSIKRGDMLLYQRQNGTYVLHRVVKVVNDCYSMCGDNQYILETGIKNEQIVAVVDSFFRKTKWVKCTNKLYILWWKFHLFLMPLRHVKGKLKSIIKKK